MLHSELQAFLWYFTASPYVPGNHLYVHFSSEVDAPAFAAGTCGRQITISTRVTDMESFLQGLCAVIGTNDFTMP